MTTAEVVRAKSASRGGEPPAATGPPRSGRGTASASHLAPPLRSPWRPWHKLVAATRRRMNSAERRAKLRRPRERPRSAASNVMSASSAERRLDRHRPHRDPLVERERRRCRTAPRRPPWPGVASAPLIFRFVPALPLIVASERSRSRKRTAASLGLREQLRLVLADLDHELRELHARAALGEEREAAAVVDRALRAGLDVAALDREVEARACRLRGARRLDRRCSCRRSPRTCRLIELEHRLAAGHRVGDAAGAGDSAASSRDQGASRHARFRTQNASSAPFARVTMLRRRRRRPPGALRRRPRAFPPGAGRRPGRCGRRSR